MSDRTGQPISPPHDSEREASPAQERQQPFPMFHRDIEPPSSLQTAPQPQLGLPSISSPPSSQVTPLAAGTLDEQSRATLPLSLAQSIVRFRLEEDFNYYNVDRCQLCHKDHWNDDTEENDDPGHKHHPRLIYRLNAINIAKASLFLSRVVLNILNEHLGIVSPVYEVLKLQLSAHRAKCAARPARCKICIELARPIAASFEWVWHVKRGVEAVKKIMQTHERDMGSKVKHD